jgi:hypothetical protein
MDKVQMMKRQLQKFIDEKEGASTEKADVKPMGLLSRRTAENRKEDLKGSERDNERIIADYIVKIRGFKKEMMNGK